jgi:4'-phosphopantetheinyl transferase
MTDVDVRVVDLHADDAALLRAEATLAPEELVRARRGVPAVHRRRVLLRGALRAALADALGIEPAAVPLATTPAGRPYVAAPGNGASLDVSCSGSGPLGVVAVGRGRRVGIDVEQVAPWSPDVLDERWLSRTEQLALTGLRPEDRPVAVTRAWTQKEAVLKARGTGLHDDPAAAVTVIGRPEGTVAGWEISDVPVPEGWVASLAVGAVSDKEMPS